MNKKDTALFATNLNHLMMMNQKTQADLEKFTGIGNKSLSTYCTGRNLPKPDRIKVIADFFNVSVDYMFRDHSNSAEKTDFIYSQIQRLDAEDQQMLVLILDGMLQRDKYQISEKKEA